MTDAMIRALVRLHDAVAARVFASATIRVMIGREVLAALAQVKKEHDDAGLQQRKNSGG